MGISINGPSGIDTAYIIESLVKLEYEKVDAVKKKQSAYDVKIEAYSKLLNMVNEIGKSARQLENEDDFNEFIEKVSNEDLVTFETGKGSVEGSYDIQVFQTAQREKLVSSDNLITDNSQSLSSLGISTGKFSINGVEIEIDADDTVLDLRTKINTTTDADGKKTGVTATVLKIASDNFRLVLTNSETGVSGADYEDLDGGTVLQDLGIITSATGEKGITAQKLLSADDISAAFSALAIDEQIVYSGKDHDGNEVSNTFIKTSSSTIDDFLKHISDTYHGMADVAIDGSGHLSITDKSLGQSSLEMTSLVFSGGPSSVVSIDTIGNSGQNVLNIGKDAFFSIDGLKLSSDENRAKDFIQGVTLEFHKASVSETVSIEMERDYDAIADKVNDLLNTFNALTRYVKTSTKFRNVEENESGGALAGDMTTNSILNQVRSVFQKNFDITGEAKFSSLTMVGIKTNTLNSEFELDRTVFKEALEESFEDVIKLFTTQGYSDNPNITLGTYSDKTTDGVYSLVEIDNDHYQIEKTLPNTSDPVLSDIRNGDIVSFTSGAAEGLSITAPQGSGNAVFTFSKGLSGHLDELIKEFSDSREGTIPMRQESWNKAKSRLDDRILTLESRVESYRIRLVKQFAAMEQTLSQLNSQSSNMLSQLGYYQ
jgi:flagellar hook-associated protein 2